MEAAKKAGIKQYYIVSTWDSSRIAVENPDDPIKTYTICKHYADLYLKNNSELNYTIKITNTHSTEVAVNQSISRADVAQVLARLLLSDGYENQEIQIAAGNTDIDTALSNIK